MFIKGLVKLYSPGDMGDVSAPGNKDQGVESDLKFLRDGNDDKPRELDQSEEDDSESEGQSDESSEGDDEGEESTEEDTEGQEEDSEEGDEEGTEEQEDPQEEDEIKVTVKGIKKDYPDFFKKHPEMKGVIFREKQFSEIYSTPQEAQQAARFANTYLQMENDLLGGNSEPLLNALKGANGGKSYDDFISNILPTLQKVDKDNYYKVVAVPLKRALRAAFREGERLNNSNLKASAQWIHNYIFENTNLDEKTEFESATKKTEKTKEQIDYENKINQINMREHVNYKKTIDNEWVNGVQRAFLDGLDPDNILSDWTKNKMFEEAITQINDQMVRDTRYMRSIQSIWIAAANSGYDPSFKTRIVNASLARAKQLIPTIRQKLRSDALNERRKISKSKETGRSEHRHIVTSGKNSNGKRTMSKSEMRGKSDLDIIRGN